MAKKPKVKVYFEKNRSGKFKRIHAYKDKDKEDTTLGFWVKLPDKTMHKVGEFVFTEEMELPDEPEEHECPKGEHWDETQEKCVPDEEPEPSEPKAPVIKADDELLEVDMHTDVTMKITVTDANGKDTIKDIVWKQTLGPMVELMVAEDKLSAKFHAHVEGDYLFTVTATDDTGLEGVQGINVKVREKVEPPPEPIGEFVPVLAAFGDSNSSSTASNTFSNINKIPNIKVLALGDFEYDSDFNDFKSKYSSLKDKTAIAVKGNHDDTESESSSIESANNSYWAWKNPANSKATVDNIGIIGIDTQESASNQKAFVEAALKEFADKDWKIVVLHKPMRSPKTKHSEESGFKSAFESVFKQYGVALVLQGHNHNQWLGKFENTVYVGTGNGGRDLYQIDSNPSYIEWSQDNDFGYVVIEQKQDKSQLKVKFFNNAGKVLHEKLINKVGTGPTPEPTECPPGQHWDADMQMCMPDEQPEPSGDVLFDSFRDTNLHDGKEGTFERVGNIGPNGLGLEGRASGDPKIVKNSDGTFSLVCKAGHGRFYGYTINYNATLEIEAAWWNEASGQDCSLKLRSRHNENDPCSNRFGGYGLSIDRNGYDSKREPCHNNHDQSTSGSIPIKPSTKQFWKLEYTVKDEADKVRQIGKFNGQQFMNKFTGRQDAPKSLFDQQSYFWVRQNIDSGTGELRIKRLRILKA